MAVAGRDDSGYDPRIRLSFFRHRNLSQPRGDGTMNPLRWLALAALVGICVPASAQDDWTGKVVILKRPGIRIGYSDEDGKQVYVTQLTMLSYKVDKEAQGFLRVKHRGESGWFPKSDAVLPDEAIAYFTERVRLANAKDSFPLAYLGWAHKELKRYDLAIVAYDNAIKRDPQPGWFNNRGLIYLEKKQLEQAIADFTEAIKRDAKYVMAIENRAAAYGQLNKTALALSDWNDVLKLEPANGPALLRRAKIFIDQKELGKAIADLSMILKNDPQEVLVLIERGQLHADLKQFDHALADFNEAIRLDKTNVDFYLGRAQLYSDKKEFAKAIADTEEALRLEPMRVDAYLSRGWNRFLTGAFEMANADFAKALAMKADHAPTYNLQAWLWATCPDAKFRDGKKAVAFAKKAVDLTQGKEPAILDTQAAALAEAGDFEQAVKLQERTIRELGEAHELLPEARARLELYRKMTPYRQTIAN
jgi:tetratricopeptide (TPR) repeat protein